MRIIGIPVLALALVGPGCGGEPGTPHDQAELDGLLQRLDAMERRLDALEETLAKQPAATDPPAAPVDPFAPPIPTAEAEAGPTLAVRLTAAGVELDGRTVADADVTERLRGIAEARPRTRLSIVAEPDVPHQAVTRLIDRAREAGLTDVAMSVRVHRETATVAP